MTTVTAIGEHKSGLLLRILCPCGTEHEIELDHSGHWKGKCSGLPVDQVIEVQLKPDQWRALVEDRTKGAIH